MAGARKALTDAQVLALTDEEVFGPSSTPSAPKDSPPSATVHAIDMEGVIKAIGTLAKQLQDSSMSDRRDILGRLAILQDSAMRVANRQMKVEVKTPESAQQAGWHFSIERDNEGEMVGLTVTPLDGSAPRTAMEAVKRAMERKP